MCWCSRARRRGGLFAEDLVEASTEEDGEPFVTQLGASYPVGELKGAGAAAEKFVSAGGAVREGLKEKLWAAEGA